MEISTIINTIDACEDRVATKKSDSFLRFWLPKLPEIKKALQKSAEQKPDRALTCRRCIRRINAVLQGAQ